MSPRPNESETPSADPSQSPGAWPDPSPQAPNPTDPAAPAEGSSPASSPGSPTSRFSVDRGPAFDDPNRPQVEPEIDALGGAVEAEIPTGWDPEKLKPILKAKGQLLHHAIAVDKESDEWVYTDAEADAVATPLAAVLNRYTMTAAAAAVADEIGLGVALFAYAQRSIQTRMASIAERDEQGPVPITGHVPGPEEMRPEDDPIFAGPAAAATPYIPTPRR